MKLAHGVPFYPVKANSLLFQPLDGADTTTKLRQETLQKHGNLGKHTTWEIQAEGREEDTGKLE